MAIAKCIVASLLVFSLIHIVVKFNRYSENISNQHNLNLFKFYGGIRNDIFQHNNSNFTYDDKKLYEFLFSKIEQCLDGWISADELQEELVQIYKSTKFSSKKLKETFNSHF